MKSLDIFTLETIVQTICPQCTPEHELPERVCLYEWLPLPSGVLGTERERIASLAALCLTSRQVSATATRHLYHRPTCSPWWRLARTLLARPDLARRVKHLYTRGWTEPGATDAESPEEVHAYWEKQVTDGEDDVPHIADLPINDAVLLVASLCPEMKELDAVVQDGEMAEFIEPVTWEKFRTIALSYADTEYGLALELVNPLIRAAPNIETLVGWQVGTNAHTADLANLKHLRLENSSVSSDGLRQLLSSCPRLESFHYVAGSPTVGDEQFGPGEAQRTIVALVPRLKSLHLDFYNEEFFHVPPAEPGLVTDLAPLTELESLSLDLRCLQDPGDPHLNGGGEPPVDAEALDVGEPALVDLIPASIRDFRVFRASGGPVFARLPRALSTLARAAPERFPNLRMVGVSGEGAESVEMVRRDFDSAGIELLTDTASR